jgi:serine/threonine protein kinase
VYNEVLGIATALQHLHSPPANATTRLYCAHLDLKPDNILIYNDVKNSTGGKKTLGVWKISDFGVSQIRHPATPPSAEPQIITAFRGTPNYAAPECDVLNPPERRMQGQAYDIWSLGCIMAEVLTFVYCDTEGVRMFEEAR